MSDTCRGFDTLPLLLMGLQASLVLIPKDAELAHEPLWRLHHLYPRWLLLRLLPHLLHPSKSLEMAPVLFCFFLCIWLFTSCCSQRKLPPLTCIHWYCSLQLGSSGWDKLFHLLYVAHSRFPKTTLLFRSCLHWEFGAGVPGTCRRVTEKTLVLESILPEDGQQCTGQGTSFLTLSQGDFLPS